MEQENGEALEFKASKHYKVVTPHGEADVLENETGDKRYLPLRTVKLEDTIKKFGNELSAGMALFHSILTNIRKKQPNRNIPVTKVEFMGSGATKLTIKSLVKAGLLKECTVGTTKGARSCFYYTNQGRAWIREYIEPSYALTEET